MIKTDASVFSKKNELLMRFHGVSLDKASVANIKHSHITDIEFSMFIKGRGIYRISDVDYEIHPGDIFFVGNKENHYISEIFEKMDYFNLRFEPRFIWSSGTSFEDNGYIKFLFDRERTLKHRFRADDEVTKKIREIMELIKGECEKKENDYVSMIRALLTVLFVELSRHSELYEMGENRNIFISDHATIDRSMDYINENLCENLTLSDIAAKANLSPNYYCNVFKKLNGVTPWEYITAKRVEKVISRLVTYEGNILELALSCGFNNTANFNRAFKKYTGKTPREYKKRKDL